jgi:tetratricopeptide (TPR) repeat protein
VQGLVNAGKYEEAIAAYKEIFTALEAEKDKITPAEWAKLHFNIGVVYQNAKDWANAEASYKKALELDPGLFVAIGGLANVYQQAKRWNDAIALYTQASASYPDNAKLVHELGLFYREARKYEEAYAQFGKAAALTPDNAEIYYDLGTTAISLNKIPEALQSLEKYVAMPTAKKENIEAAKQIIPALKQATSAK